MSSRKHNPNLRKLLDIVKEILFLIHLIPYQSKMKSREILEFSRMRSDRGLCMN